MESLVTMDTILPVWSKCRPYIIVPSFAIFTATLPVAARAEGIGFLFDSIDVTTPSLRNYTQRQKLDLAITHLLIM